MKKTRNRTMATVIALFLTFAIAIPLSVLPTVWAYNYDTPTQTAINNGMYWVGMSANASATRLLLWNRFGDQIPTWVFAIAAPNPVGVGQTFNVVMFNPQVPPSAALGNNIRYQYTLAVKKPDGTTQSLPTTGTYVSDPTGSTYTAYTPDQVGNYSLTVTFLKLQYLWNSTVGGGSNDYYGTTFKQSTYTLTVVVQQTPVSLIGLPAILPLPSAFWTRPIEGENTNWYTIASNWLSDGHDSDYEAGSENRYQPNGIAPNSPHILWTKPLEDNGLVGGNDLSRPGNVFNAGSQYQPRFTWQIIMYGRLYYSPNTLYSGSSEMLDCVDLLTGQRLWEDNTTGIGQASFGYYYSQDDPNQHGIVNPGWIFTSNYARAYQPALGFVSGLNITNVPSGLEIPGPSGENLRYVLTNLGNSTKPNYYLAQWNSSKVFMAQVSGFLNASLPSRYDWNISMPIAFTTSPTIRAVKLNSVVFGSNGSWPTGSGSPSYAYPQSVTIWAVSLDPSNKGQLLYMKTIDVDTSDNQNIIFQRADAEEGVWVALESPTCKFIGYSIYTGDKLWETDAQASDVNPYGYYTWPSLISATQTKMAYGMLYTGGYGGSVSAYNATNGKLVWRYTAPSGGEKINDYTLMIALICDGKIYVGTHEHSADTPLYKGMRLRCLNATTGDALWTMSSWVYPESIATADGVLIYWNNYDGQIYAVGKGPSATTVQAPMTAITAGDTVEIQGTVIDVSAGTKQKEQAADFPNGVPAMSDASMSEWMEYVYMQKAKPANATGVEVSIDAIDPNGNCVHLGTATSDASGLFHYAWKTPDIPGEYTVTATFAGSESYWPSNAETAMYVSETPPSPTPTPAAAPLPPFETYILLATVAIIIAIAIVGILLLRKRP